MLALEERWENLEQILATLETQWETEGQPLTLAVLCLRVIIFTSGLDICKLLNDDCFSKVSEAEKKHLCLWFLDEFILRYACILESDRKDTPQEFQEFVNIRNELVKKQRTLKRQRETTKESEESQKNQETKGSEKTKKKDRESVCLNGNYCSTRINELRQKGGQATKTIQVLGLLVNYFNKQSDMSRSINQCLIDLLSQLGLEVNRLNRSETIEVLKQNGYQLKLSAVFESLKQSGHQRKLGAVFESFLKQNGYQLIPSEAIEFLKQKGY